MSGEPADESASSEERSGKSPDGLAPLRDIIRRYDLAAKKSLGQNFLLDLNLTRRIARHAGELLGDRSGHLGGRTVVEVGPGPGGLTRALFLEGAGRVIAVERDERCLEALAEVTARYDGRLSVHSGDALEADWPALLPPGTKAVIAANLPYGVATMLLINWLETEPWPPWWDGMVLMFQKEVAERIVAEPGSKAYGRLSVISQWRTDAGIVMTLKPEAFTPPPKVASAVVAFRPRAEPQPACSVKALGAVTAAAFGQRRKMLRASLKALVPNPEELLDAAGISPELRAERVPVRDFAKLALVYEKSRAGR